MTQHNHRTVNNSWLVCFPDEVLCSVLSCAVPLCAKFREGKDGMRFRGLWDLLGSARDGQRERAHRVVYRSLSHF